MTELLFSLDGLSFQRPEIKIDHNLYFEERLEDTCSDKSFTVK